MSSVNLILDNYQLYPGNIITGKAVCSFASTKEVRKVRIRLKGIEHTQWRETERYYDSMQKKHRSRSVEYSGYNQIILMETIVHGEGQMNPGEHVFPFEFTLPHGLPSSFKHMYGKIYYSVKLTVDRPWKIDFEDKKEVVIISPINMQIFPPHFQQPAEYSDEKTVCCFCCASGPVQLDVNLQKKAFVVGEHVPVKVLCMNMSNTNVDGVHVKIISEVKFMSITPGTHYKTDRELVASSDDTGVGAHGERTYNFSVEIPPLAVIPNFTGCQLFHCENELKVNAAISGCHSDLDISTSVAIGHIPYSQPVPFGNQYEQTPPPYPAKQPTIGFTDQASDEIKPMPMPLPGIPPYPVPNYSPGPSAPTDNQAPSAPPKLNSDGNTFDSDAGNSSSNEPPPPSYDEAATNLLPK